MDGQNNPFRYYQVEGRWYYQVSAEDRIRACASFTAAQCTCALELPGLQKTVAAALRRRLRQLQKGAA
jgi:uncharacterized Zn finger protein